MRLFNLISYIFKLKLYFSLVLILRLPRLEHFRIS